MVGSDQRPREADRHGGRRWLTALVAVTALLLPGCGGAGADTSDVAGPPAPASEEAVRSLRLGFFPNVTHATAIVGLEEGLFADALGEDVVLETATFHAGGAAVEALFSGAIDATFIGPNPAINAFAQSRGEAVRLVAGATSGGAALVVRDGVEGPADLVGATLSSPALGNTQDVALRAWLADQGLATTAAGGGDVSIAPQENAQIMETFRSGDIDGAWVPEPWATRLIEEGGGRLLVDERDLWPGGRFVTTHLLVSTEYLEANPGIVRRLLAGHVAATDFVNEQPDQARTVVLEAIETLTGAGLSPDTLARAWDHLEFTVDPMASSLQESADDAVDAGLLEPVDLDGIYDLSLLNEVLAEQGREEVTQ